MKKTLHKDSSSLTLQDLNVLYFSKTKNEALPDNYTYSGSNTLKNKYGVKSFIRFVQKCEHDVVEAIINLRQEALPKKFDSSYLKYLHKRLFGNTFEWAGHTRDLPFKFEDGTVAVMSKIGSSSSIFSLAVGDKIKECLEKIDRILSEKNNLKGLSCKEFVNNAGEIFTFLINIHPFREGNELTQQIFFEKLAEAAGHKLDFSVVTKERMKCIYSDAIMLKGDVDNTTAVKHLFEDISNPEKVSILKEFINYRVRVNAASCNINNQIIVAPNEGDTYTGTYEADSPNSIMIKTTDFCVICYKDYFTPEQLRALKFGDKITFTAPITKNLDQILIPAEKLAPLTEEKIIERVVNNIYVQKSREEVEHLSKLVYGNSKILDQNLHLIHKNPEIGKQLAEQIENSPQSISNLAGFKIGVIKSPKRKIAEKNFFKLRQVIEKYVDTLESIKNKILKEHQVEQRRLGKAIKMPSEAVLNILNSPKDRWNESLEFSPSLREEFNSFMSKVVLRLSTREHKALNEADYKTLAESISISENRARIITKIFNKAKEICLEFREFQINRLKIMMIEN
ncbi:MULTISPECIES: BID domain-containing T4SS effector [unclassified Bartonella]|uniref:BID domain-containing T4SS effector n=1 Tax=unclassified Bartonella TaxID=2645622 RepID=UPI00099AB2FD|nr:MULTISPECIES: BID domain-containing T4SS effector [unclassified Bartonella]AQX27885.1 Bartonella effector protein Bep8/3 [Bartonella sp. JB15]AQX29165.1 Bartonella effector protein Bep8/3 [Bartonella sp. JB63]